LTLFNLFKPINVFNSSNVPLPARHFEGILAADIGTATANTPPAVATGNL
jgi:hypothetical protein